MSRAVRARDQRLDNGTAEQLVEGGKAFTNCACAVRMHVKLFPSASRRVVSKALYAWRTVPHGNTSALAHGQVRLTVGGVCKGGWVACLPPSLVFIFSCKEQPWYTR